MTLDRCGRLLAVASLHHAAAAMMVGVCQILDQLYAKERPAMLRPLWPRVADIAAAYQRPPQKAA
jgi:hypothetical protein